MDDNLKKYHKEKNHRKLIQSLVSLFNHQDLSLRLCAHSYLVYFAKLCSNKRNKSSIPYCYRLFLIYQTLISVLCSHSEHVRRISIKALFIWIVTCNDDLIAKDLKNNMLTLKHIGPLILCIEGITDMCYKNRMLVFNQLNELLSTEKSLQMPLISTQNWIQMFYKKPCLILDVESVTDLIPLFYKPILNNDKFLFLHTSFALNYSDLLNKIDHIFNEKSILENGPYLYVHIDALKRNSCGVFSHVLDDEMREVRIASLQTLKQFVKYQLNDIICHKNTNKVIEIAVNVSRDLSENGPDASQFGDTSEAKINFENENEAKYKILSRAMSFIADLLNDESVKVRIKTLLILKEIMIFGSDYLKIGDDFLPLIQIMTGDFIQEIRSNSYETLQYLYLSKPLSLLSVIKSLNHSIVRYPNDKEKLLYSLSILSYKHSRLLEAILNKLIPSSCSLAINNLKHLCLAVIIYYGSMSNNYLLSQISNSVTIYINQCKSKYENIFKYDMNKIKRQCQTYNNNNNNMDNISDLQALNHYFIQLFQENVCNLKLLNTIIKVLHSLNKQINIHSFLSLWDILNDILQLIELNICTNHGFVVHQKLIQLEHHIIILYKLCIKRNKINLSGLLLSFACCLYFIVCNNNEKIKIKIEDISQFVLQIDTNFNVDDRNKHIILEKCNDLINKNISLWPTIKEIFDINVENYMNCFKEFNELISGLSNSNRYNSFSNQGLESLINIIQLKSEQNKIYFHPLAPIEIPIKCIILSEYAFFMQPKLKIRIFEKNSANKKELKYTLFSTKKWIKDLEESDYLTFCVKIPNLAISTNINPVKNYYADLQIEMISEHSHCVLQKIIPSDTDIIVSNKLSVDIVMGFV